MHFYAFAVSVVCVYLVRCDCNRIYKTIRQAFTVSCNIKCTFSLEEVRFDEKDNEFQLKFRNTHIRFAAKVYFKFDFVDFDSQFKLLYIYKAALDQTLCIIRKN